MRCDLHVHTVHSGMCTIPIARRFCRESYNQPEAVYETLKGRGMNLVTVTDHDSMDAAASLSHYSDFFASEEVTCILPSGSEAHVAVYGIDERQHIEIQRRRSDLPAFLAYLNERNVVFGINHIYSGLTGRRTLEDFEWFEREFPVVEVLNASMVRLSNAAAARFAQYSGKTAVAGSDSHTIGGLASAWTEVPGARTEAEFLAGLRHGWTRIHGVSGSYWKLTRDILTIARELMRERAWALALAPALFALPAVTLLNYLHETAFAGRWARAVAQAHSSRAALGFDAQRARDGAAA
jgi:predicted metal-dependent phosphoesterase TrpH